MTPTELIAVWNMLEKDPPGDNGSVRRRLFPEASSDIFASITWPNGNRGLMIEAVDDDPARTRRVPRCRGVRIGTRPIAGLAPPRTSLHIVLEEGRLQDIFAVLATDLVNSLSGSADEAMRGTVDRLSMWQALFDRLPPDGLSSEEQRGLFGELHLMKQLLLPTIGASDAVFSWAGPDSAKQDFETRGVAFEVKSSLAKRHARLTIASEKQLDERPLLALFLCHVRLDESEAGRSLPDLVADVRKDLVADAVAASEFELRLAKTGYLAVHEPLYASPRYKIASLRFFEVRDSFPRLTEANLPPGVGDIRYTIIADDLAPFEAAVDAVADRLRLAHG